MLLELPILEGTRFRARFATELRSAARITTLQINLGYICNLACNHCHVESSPARTGPGENDYVTELAISNTYRTVSTVDDALARMTQMTEPWLSWVSFTASHTPLHMPPVDPYDCTLVLTNDNREMYDAMTSE